MNSARIKRLIYLVLGLSVSLTFTGCNTATQTVRSLQEYYTELRIGAPEIVSTVSAHKFAYSRLDNEERVVYDQILACIVDHVEQIPISTKDEELLKKVYPLVLSDNPGIFWVDGYEFRTYSHGDYVTGMQFLPEYTMDRSTRDVKQEQVDEIVKSWIEQIPADSSDYQKSKFVFEKLIRDVDYVSGAPDNQNILSVFLGGSTVCQGYACASSYLFDKIGIPSFVVTGVAAAEPHAWNIIELDGEYYFFDVTWGNSSFRDGSVENKMTDYSFLNATTKVLSKTHEPMMDIELPQCVSIEDNYFNKEGLYFDNWDVDYVGGIITNHYNSGAKSVSLMFATRDAYLKAVDYIIEQKHFADLCPGLLTLSYLNDEDMDVLTLKFSS